MTDHEHVGPILDGQDRTVHMRIAHDYKGDDLSITNHYELHRVIMHQLQINRGGIPTPHTTPPPLGLELRAHLLHEHGVSELGVNQAGSWRELHTKLHEDMARNSPTNDGSYRVSTLRDLRAVMAELADLDELTPVRAQAEAGQVSVNRVDIGVYENLGIVIDLDT